MQRWSQIVLGVTFVLWCWLAMMATHELGHVLAAWASGGHVTQVVLHPLAISRTDVSPNPHPLFVVWAGPVIGATLPLVGWCFARISRMNWTPLAKFFAGFCLIANGLYLGVGSWDGVGDAGDLLKHGAAVWQLWLFGLICVPLGLTLWNGTGVAFGLGERKGKVDPHHAIGSTVLLLLTIILEVCLSKQL